VKYVFTEAQLARAMWGRRAAARRRHTGRFGRAGVSFGPGGLSNWVAEFEHNWQHDIWDAEPEGDDEEDAGDGDNEWDDGNDVRGFLHELLGEPLLW